jgi:DNA gyrase subunit A
MPTITTIDPVTRLEGHLKIQVTVDTVNGVQQVTEDDQLMLVTNTGKIIRMRIKDIRVIGRNTQGVRLIDLEEGERVVSLARLAEKEEEEEDPPPVDP